MSMEPSELAIVNLPLTNAHPSPENDAIYHPVDPDDPEIVKLAESIARLGIQEPLLLSDDFFILSGHRRHAAAKLAGLKTVPCRIRQDVSRTLSGDYFLQLLRECNRQRNKTWDEKVREELVSVNQSDAYAHLIEYRQNRVMVHFRPEAFVMGRERGRAEISHAKLPMLLAVQKVIEDNREYWPLSVRTVHYVLLNFPPLIHAAKPDST